MMILQNETNQTITTTHEQLTTINHELNKYLKQLLDKNTSLTEGDRKLIRTIRDKNLETIQLIDKMSYTWECDLQ